MDREESRYAHLLAPIRDLAQNWHTDIAAELSDYLSQLEEITFTFDGGNTNLNFAEAALLIQGSTCVYSRKVEYLHKLVFNALEAVATKRRAANALNANAADDELDFDNDVDTFLALDDVLQGALRQGDGIDLDDSAAARTAVTAKGADSAFLALRDVARNGAAQDAETQHASFQVASCAVHFTGALLLDPRDASLLDEHLQYVQPEAEQQAAQQAAAAYDDDFGGDGAPMAGGWDDDDAPPAPHAADGTPARQAQHLGGGAPFMAIDQEEEEDGEPDPWAPLDFDDPNGLPVRPFRKGKTQLRDAPAASSSMAAAQARAAVEARSAQRLGAIFTEFAYAYEARSKQRQKEARAAAASASAREHAAPAVAAAANAVPNGGAFDDAYDDFSGFGGGGMSDDDVGMPPAPADADAVDMGALEAAAAAGVALPGMADILGGRPGGAAAGEGPSYEDLVRAHVERYMAAAAALVTQTELASRVASWKAKIEPALLEQESRPLFDIHALGAQVMDSIQQAAPDTPDAAALPPRVRFDEFMHESPAYEVARAFAATLQLVNSGNVRIVEPVSQEGGESRDAGCFTLELLEMTHANAFLLDAYLAPSQLPPAEPAADRPKAVAAKKKKADAPPAPKRRAALRSSQDVDAA